MKIIIKPSNLFNKILLNYRCEENPPGSGNFKCDVNASSDKDLDRRNKNRLKELKTSLKDIKTKNQSIRDQMDKLSYESSEWKKLQNQIDLKTEYKIEDSIKTLQYKHPDAPESFKPFLQNSDTIIKNLSTEENKQLKFYIHGWGNIHFQDTLAKFKGNIPTDLDTYVKNEIATKLSFGDTKKFNPDDSFHVKEYKDRLEYYTNMVSSINKMDSILNKSKISNDIIVQTGVSPILLGIDKIEPGTEFEIPTYISTSRSEVIANGFALRKYSQDKKYDNNPTVPTVLEMHLKEGSRAIALENFVLESAGPTAEWVIGDKGTAGTGSQQEVLLARNTKCIVRDVQEETFRGRQIRKIIVDASN